MKTRQGCWKFLLALVGTLLLLVVILILSAPSGDGEFYRIGLGPISYDEAIFSGISLGDGQVHRFRIKRWSKDVAVVFMNVASCELEEPPWQWDATVDVEIRSSEGRVLFSRKAPLGHCFQSWSSTGKRHCDETAWTPQLRYPQNYVDHSGGSWEPDREPIPGSPVRFHGGFAETTRSMEVIVRTSAGTIACAADIEIGLEMGPPTA